MEKSDNILGPLHSAFPRYDLNVQDDWPVLVHIGSSRIHFLV